MSKAYIASRSAGRCEACVSYYLNDDADSIYLLLNILANDNHSLLELAMVKFSSLCGRALAGGYAVSYASPSISES